MRATSGKMRMISFTAVAAFAVFYSLASSLSLGIFLGAWTLLWALIAATKETPSTAVGGQTA
jgi:hypothetical protein